ncbi:MAG TPA: glycosyltransferase family 2 protein [Candidatus Sumerlaeota bacterium]|mgnify:CR=1 FL=1|nr:glycosyltransferase family 2 protein [Candidatus Sumerlaeota bacterium]
MTKPQISVVIVNWNARDHLQRCLVSIEETRGALVVETIVVDNGSVDGSLEMLSQCFPHVQVVATGQNLGFARGNNVGIERCRADFIFFINSDVIVKPGCFQQLLDLLQQRPEVGLAGPRIVSPDGSLQATCCNTPSLKEAVVEAFALRRVFPAATWLPTYFLVESEHDRVREVPCMVGCFWAARREAIDQVGVLDERFFIYSEDNDWCKRFREAGWQVLYYPLAEAIHVGGASSARDPMRFAVEMEKARRQFWTKHYGGTTLWLYVLVRTFHHGIRAVLKALFSCLSPTRRDLLRQHCRAHWRCVGCWYRAEKNSSAASG